jgi:hypothetical protein
VTPREFRAKYHEVDPEVIGPLWRVFLCADWDNRAALIDALDSLEAKAEGAQFGARHRAAPPPPRGAAPMSSTLTRSP